MSILFITGTDTGVGKTVFTTALLWELRRRGIHALAMKPFCTGDRHDVELIQSIQGRKPAADIINPFYFPAPVTPLAAARQQRRRIRLSQVLHAISEMKRRARLLLLEGAGGLLSPLGAGFSAREVIQALGCPAVVVAPDRLGTINQTRLTVESLRAGGVEQIVVVLMGQRRADVSTKSNALLLKELLRPLELIKFPHLGSGAGGIGVLEKRIKIFEKTLAPFWDVDRFCARSSVSGVQESAERSDRNNFKKRC